MSCCRGALDTAAQEKDETIVFWLYSFAAVSSEWRVIIFEILLHLIFGVTILVQSWSFFVTVQCKNQLLVSHISILSGSSAMENLHCGNTTEYPVISIYTVVSMHTLSH